MFTWPPPSYLHELAFNNEFEEAHLERHFVFMVLHTVFAELEWDCSGCENNLSVFCDNLPAIFSLYPRSGIMMDRRSMWVIQTLTARERRGPGHDYLSINIGDIWSWSPAHQADKQVGLRRLELFSGALVNMRVALLRDISLKFIAECSKDLNKPSL